jgi:hypothetical protein
LNEKRRCTRNPASLVIDCQLFSLDSEFIQWEGMLLNYSDEGVYIELRRPCSEGNLLWMRPLPGSQVSPDDPIGPCPCMGLLEVKWCQLLEDEGTQRFGIGLRHLETFS